MPACLAASMMVVPFGTAIRVPSIVTVTVSWVISDGSLVVYFSSYRNQRRLPRLGDVRFELRAEFLDPAHHRGRARVAQDADGLPGHLLRQVEQKIQILFLPLPRQDPLENLRGPRGPLATLSALGTGLVGVESRQPPDLIDHVGRVVHHDHS